MKRTIAAIAFLLLSTAAQAGIVMGGTRVVYQEGKREAAISVTNADTHSPYLVQSWVENYAENNKSRVPFIVTPPLFRLDPEQQNVLRINYIGGTLPTDRESVFWLNIKNIPPSSSKKETSSLEIAIKTRIKLFWRPAAITLIPEKAVANVAWSKQGRQLIVQNNNPIHINIMDVSVDGKDIPVNMIKPFEKLSLTLPPGSAGHTLVWRFINDYGAVSNPVKQVL